MGIVVGWRGFSNQFPRTWMKPPGSGGPLQLRKVDMIAVVERDVVYAEGLVYDSAEKVGLFNRLKISPAAVFRFCRSLSSRYAT